jgi:hypothetical protein
MKSSKSYSRIAVRDQAKALNKFKLGVFKEKINALIQSNMEVGDYLYQYGMLTLGNGEVIYMEPEKIKVITSLPDEVSLKESADDLVGPAISRLTSILRDLGYTMNRYKTPYHPWLKDLVTVRNFNLVE